MYNLPKTEEERQHFLRAQLSCPVFAIHSSNLEKGELKKAQQSLPYPYLDTKNVFYCGWTSYNTFGCYSFMVTREQGNVMIDVPRYNPVLAKRIEEMGGIKYILLTHKDDIGDHKKWAEHFKATRVLHKNEVDGRSEDVEIKLEGKGPEWHLEGLEDIDIIF